MYNLIRILVNGFKKIHKTSVKEYIIRPFKKIWCGVFPEFVKAVLKINNIGSEIVFHNISFIL